MPQPNAVPILGLIYPAATGTGAGLSLMLQGQIAKWPYVGVGTNPLGLFPMPIKYYFQLSDTATGAACTFQPQVCNDNSTWVSWGTSVVISALSGLNYAIKRTGVVKNAFFRLNVSALSGTAPQVQAYCVIGSTP